MQSIPQLADYEYALETYRDVVRQIVIFDSSETVRDDAEAVLENLKLSTTRQLFQSTAGTAAYAKLMLAWHDVQGAGR